MINDQRSVQKQKKESSHDSRGATATPAPPNTSMVQPQVRPIESMPNDDE